MKLALIFVLAALIGCSENRQSATTFYEIVDDTIPASLTGEPGDPERGQKVFSDRELGHCVLCHQIGGLEAEFQGNLGPDLSFVGDRLSLAQLRLRVVDYQSVQPGAVMPSYFRDHDLYDVGAEYVGSTVLSREDVEDVIAYLAAQKR